MWRSIGSMTFLALLMAGCGGSSSGPTYTVGGTVTGLCCSGLVLQNEGGDDLPMSASGRFTFATPMPSGASYSVTVKTTPASEGCGVKDGAGTIVDADVTNVQVYCGFHRGYSAPGLTGVESVPQMSAAHTRADKVLTYRNPPQMNSDGSFTDTPWVSIYASGLNNPRGLKFGPDGHLYVAEGGTGGGESTTGMCDHVAPPVGPYTGSPTGSRVSRIDADGTRSTVADGFPSSQTSVNRGSLISGASDVAFIGTTLYVLTAGSGCSHGVANTTNGIFRVLHNGSHAQIADLSSFYVAHPVAQPEPDDFEPDGTPYSMIADTGLLFVVESNHGELDAVGLNGHIHRITDISASQGHSVPTSVARHDGNFYVGNLNRFPIVSGSSKILKISPRGDVTVVAEGLTTVLGLAFDKKGRLYALENTSDNPFPTPGTGRVVRVGPQGQIEVIASGLFLPTAMTFGPDDNLYISNVGFGPPPVGLGQILKVELAD